MTDAALSEFKMPDVGEGLTEAEILKWYVAPGDTVTDGQVVCEVETAKAAVELPIPFNGVVRELRFPEGTTVDVGQVIISVDVSGGAAPAAPAEEAAVPAPAEEAPAPKAAAEEAAPAGRQPVLVGYGVAESSTKRRARKAGAQDAQDVPVAEPEPVAPREVNGHGARPLAKPPVRKLAKDLGVDLARVTPSGPDGIITREDVHAAAAPAPRAEDRPEPAEASAPPTAPAPVAGADARETRIPVKGVRKATAQAMVGSAFTAPHVTEFVTVDVTRTMKLVEEIKRDPGTYGFEGLRVNPLLLIAKALLVAIRRRGPAAESPRPSCLDDGARTVGVGVDAARTNVRDTSWVRDPGAKLKAGDHARALLRPPPGRRGAGLQGARRRGGRPGAAEAAADLDVAPAEQDGTRKGARRDHRGGPPRRTRAGCQATLKP